MRLFTGLFLAVVLTNCASVAQSVTNETTNSSSNNMEKMSPATTGSELPYYQIPDYPDTMTAGTVIARTLDGLGYRYFWATKDLSSADLEYLPGNDGRSTAQTLEHLLGLSRMIRNTAEQQPNIRPVDQQEMEWTETRKTTLQNIKAASDIFKLLSEEEIASHSIIFQRGATVNKMPVWHLFNGPIADALYHVGQIVSYRRSSGNPMHPGVNVFMGKTKE